MHIAGWRREFDASQREIEDLIDFCRLPTTSPLRQLLEQGLTAVELQDPMTPLPPGPLPVELRITRNSEPIEVWTLGGASYSLGIVAAASHADIALIGSSGLDFNAETDGARLTLRNLR